MTSRDPRRSACKQLAAIGISALAATTSLTRASARSKPIVIGLPIVQSGTVVVADHAEYLQGARLAVMEINATGGLRGRPIELLPLDINLRSADGTRATFRKFVDAKVHAIASPFVFIARAAMEALVNYKAPYVHGNTSTDAVEMVREFPDRFGHIFALNPPEYYYGAGFPSFLEKLAAGGVWKPANNKVHIIQDQIAYTQIISKATQQHLSRSRFELARVTDIHQPVRDWGPVLQDIHKTGAGVVMLCHWVAAEEAEFAKQFAANPLKDALVYVHYGPSQSEFLALGGAATEGLIWGTVAGVYADQQGTEFRRKYLAAHPASTGLSYSGSGYDSMYLLAQAWQVVEPENFKAVTDFVRKNTYRGVNGFYRFDNPHQAPLHYPLQTQDLSKGMAQLFFQVQDGKHRIFGPDALAEVKFRPAPWMGS